MPLTEAKEKPTIFKVVPEARITHFGKNYHKIHLKARSIRDQNYTLIVCCINFVNSRVVLLGCIAFSLYNISLFKIRTISNVKLTALRYCVMNKSKILQISYNIEI